MKISSTNISIAKLICIGPYWHNLVLSFIYLLSFGIIIYKVLLFIAKLLKKIVGDTDAKKIGLCIFFDLKRAFDLVDHSKLLKKLNYYGIRGISNNSLGSFLEDSNQYFYLNNTSSTVKLVQLGVPQGSILFPLLFIIFINDVVNSK